MAEIKVTSLYKFYILLLLHQQQRHGYEMLKLLEVFFGKEVSAAHVYPFLQVLEKHKLIAHLKAEARERKQYFLTAKGKQFTRDLLKKFDVMTDSLVKAKVRKCAHCSCEIYSNGFEKKIAGKKLLFCCRHCARH